MTPAQLGYCIKGYNLKRQRQDMDMWDWWGNYGISAVVFSVDHCLNGKKARSEYIKEPIMYKREESESNNKNNEQLAVFEMKQRMRILEKQGGMLSPE
jgi:hypothetical protein